MDRNIEFRELLHPSCTSLSARRAWIEMLASVSSSGMSFVALRKESVDRNSHAIIILVLKSVSLSARRAWIEITSDYPASCRIRSLSARRAWIEILFLQSLPNTTRWSLSARRAWIEMLNPNHPAKLVKLSLSARRAWIEIPAKIKTQCKCHVALRKESVDRNARSCARFSRCLKSLSARRAWIEIWINVSI